jgi:hypothetical protein
MRIWLIAATRTTSSASRDLWGGFLSRRGCPLVAIDANGPVNRLIGRYFNSAPKSYKGSDARASAISLFGSRHLRIALTGLALLRAFTINLYSFAAEHKIPQEQPQLSRPARGDAGGGIQK